jgi:geranylgeranyl pyrophosphate synthase
MQSTESTITNLSGRSSGYRVQEIVNSHLSTPGKFIRPRIIELFGKLFDLEREKQLLISRSAELIHTASLIHDDVVDEAELRRGQRTLNKKTSNSQAVLAGDFLLARVIGELVTAGEYEILKTISEALEDIVEGEFLQDQLKKKGTNSKEELIEVSRKKTGALLAWCCSSVAKVSNASEEVIRKCHLFGEKIGVAFQMIDDNLDFSDLSGKDKNKDLKDGLINFTTLNLLKNYPELFYIVHQMRSTPCDAVPWNENQIETALKETRQEVDVILNEAKELFNEISQTTSASNTVGITEEVFQFIDQIKERTK